MPGSENQQLKKKHLYMLVSPASEIKSLNLGILNTVVKLVISK